MTRQLLVVGVLAALVAGCASPTTGGGPAKAVTTASFTGAKVRVLNLSDGNADASLNGQTYGRSLETEGVSSFKLTAFKKPATVSVASATGSHEYSVPLKGATAFTVVYTGTDEPTVITGEPTEIAGGKSIVYFHSLIEGGSGQKLKVKPGIGNEVEVAFAASKEVPPGSYEASVQLPGGKTARVTFDTAAGDAVTLLLMGTSSSPKLMILQNNTKMLIMGTGGASPTG